MNASSNQSPVWSHEIQQRNLRWNYAAMIADGATYMAGMAFVSAESVLPSMVKDLGGADWLIALSPSFLLIGSMVTPLFMVHHIERLRSYRPFVFRMSIPQRLIPLLAGLCLLFAWDYIPRTAFWLAALTQFFMGLTGGLGSAAFWELFGKVIPTNKRSSNTAWRNGIGLIVGIAAGAVIGGILSTYPGRTGYGLLLLMQATMLCISGVFFYMIREYPDPPHEARPHRSMREVLMNIPKVLASEKNFRLFILVRSLGQAHVIVIPFLALYFRRSMGLGDHALGYFVQAQMAGGLLGNIFAGYVGDKLGAKLPLQCSRAVALLLCVAAIFTTAPWAAIACFFLIGIVININQISENMLILELASPENRPALVAMQSILLMPVTLLFGLTSKWLFQATENVQAQGAVAAVLILVSLLILNRIRDPRQARTA